jgi:hypothetical protein
MTAIVFKLALAVAVGLQGAWVLRSRLMDLPEGLFRRAVLALQLVPALGLFLILYGFGNQEPTSDVPAYYMPAAHAALAGQVAFRDFTLSYGPLFATVGAALVFAWNSGKVFALFAILLYAAGLLWWHSAASACFERFTVRRGTVLYATSGHVLAQALLGTNQAWISAALAASCLLLVRNRSLASGLVQAVAACTTKVLAHLFWPVLWICAPRRSRWAAAAVLPTAAVYAAFVAVGAGPGLLYPLRHEGELISPGNLPYLLEPAVAYTGPLEPVVFNILTVTALALTTVWLYFRARRLPPQDRRKVLLAGLALTGLVFMLFSKKSFTGYVIFVMYPIVLVIVRGLANSSAAVGFLLGFNALLVIEPSLWFHLGGNHWKSLRGWFAAAGAPVVTGFLLLDVALVACYVYLAWLSVRGVVRTEDGAMSSRNSSQSATACSLV